MYKFFGNKPHC